MKQYDLTTHPTFDGNKFGTLYGLSNTPEFHEFHIVNEQYGGVLVPMLYCPDDGRVPANPQLDFPSE